MPRYDVRALHSTVVSADPSRTYAALRDIDLRRSRAIRCLFAIRTLPARLSRRRTSRATPPRHRSFLESALAQGWVLLEEIPDRELVIGTITQPWQPVVKFRAIPAAEFVAFTEPGFAKIIWSIAVEPGAAGSRVTLETRVLTTDPVARRRFGRYWMVFSPFIKWVRRLMLALLRRELRQSAAPRTI